MRLMRALSDFYDFLSQNVPNEATLRCRKDTNFDLLVAVWSRQAPKHTSINVWLSAKWKHVPKACKNMQTMDSPDAADEPQQQEEPEPRSHAGQTSKQPVDSQRHNQDPAAPPLVSQVSPHVAAHHHSWRTGNDFNNNNTLICF